MTPSFPAQPPLTPGSLPSSGAGTGGEGQPGGERYPTIEDPAAAQPRRPPRWAVLAVLGLVALAAALRLWRLADIPPGFHVDEAFNVLDARRVLAGWRPVFLPDNAGREVLYTYLQATLMAALGDSLLVARLASALAGTATVLAVAWFAWQLPVPRRARVMVLAAAFLTLSYWHLHFSRFGIRAVFFPLVVTLALGLWLRLASRTEGVAQFRPDVLLGDIPPRSTPAKAGAQPPLTPKLRILGGKGVLLAGPRLSPGWTLGNWSVVTEVSRLDPVRERPDGLGPRPRADGGGALAATRRDKVDLLLLALLLGLAAYAHPAGRALAVVPALDALWRAWRGDRRPLKVLAVALAGAAVVALPLAVFWFQHPWLFTGHAEEVSVAPLGPAAVLANVGKVLGMFNLAGDPARWRNLSGRPVFEPLTGLFFLGGLLVAARALRRGADWARLVLLWLVVLVLPSVLSDAAPNFSRAIGALPAACLLPALALDEAVAWIEGRARRGIAVAVAVVVIAHAGVHTGYDYLARWARDPATPLAFDADKVAIARYLDGLSTDGGQPYTTFETAGHATVRAASSHPPRGFDATSGLVLPPPGAPDAVYVFRPDEAAAVDRLRTRLNELIEVVDALSPYGGVTRPAIPAPCPNGAGCPPVALRVVQIPHIDLRADLDLYLHPDEVPDLARFGPSIRLRGARYPADVRPGETITVTLAWQAIQTPDRYLNTLVHLDTTRPDGTIVGVANGDGPPLRRRDSAESSYPTDSWQSGETIIAQYPLTIAADAPAGPADLLVGWYDPAAPGERLPVDAATADQDRRENGTVFRVGTITVVRERVEAFARHPHP